VRREDPVWGAKRELIRRLLEQAGVSLAMQGPYFIFAYNVYRKRCCTAEQIEEWTKKGLRKELLERIAKIASAG
jgi:hypothetical protein